MAKTKKEDAIVEEIVIAEETPTPINTYDVDLAVERDIFKNQLKLDENVVAYLSAKVGEKIFTVKPGVYNYSRNLVDANHIAWYRLKENCWVGATGKVEFLGKIELPEVTKPVERKKFKTQLEVSGADAYLEPKDDAIVLDHLQDGIYNLLDTVGDFYRIAENQFIKISCAKVLEAPPLKPLNEIVAEVREGKWGESVGLVHNLEDAGYDYSVIQNEINRINREEMMAKIEPIAREVMEGKWGEGMEKIKKLKKAGYDIGLIDNKIFELLALEDESLIKIGDSVKIIKPFDYFGKKIFPKSKKYTIIERSYNSIIVSKNEETFNIHKDNLKKVK